MKIDKTTAGVWAAMLAIGAVFWYFVTILVLSSVANAHHPLVSGVAECDDDTPGLYQVVWTVKSDAVRGYEWSIGEAGTKPDSQDYVFIERGLSQDTITKTITATWYDQQGRLVAGPSSSTSAPVTKPTGCTPETSTTWPSSTSSTTTSTTVPTTSTSVTPTTSTLPSTSTSSPTTSTPPSSSGPTTTASPGTTTPSTTATTSAAVTTPTTDMGDTSITTAAESSTPPSSSLPNRQLPETGVSHRGIALIAGVLILFGLVGLWIRTPR